MIKKLKYVLKFNRISFNFTHRYILHTKYQAADNINRVVYSWTCAVIFILSCNLHLHLFLKSRIIRFITGRQKYVELVRVVQHVMDNLLGIF